MPLVAVSRLAVLAEGAGTWSAALDAGRGGVYLHTEQEEWLCTEGEARSAVKDEGALAVCEDKVAALFRGARRVSAPTAADALKHAQQRLLAREWDDAASLDALYLWRAERMLRTSVQL